mmetsp:Transcript_127435/g.254610  ORF Transcript_127435/g.254610 Transcript_127435/m.254610 type:complete len:205 (-) Transcript_127435:109-723(-)
MSATRLSISPFAMSPSTSESEMVWLTAGVGALIRISKLELPRIMSRASFRATVRAFKVDFETIPCDISALLEVINKAGSKERRITMAIRRFSSGWCAPSSTATRTSAAVCVMQSSFGCKTSADSSPMARAAMSWEDCNGRDLKNTSSKRRSSSAASCCVVPWVSTQSKNSSSAGRSFPCSSKVGDRSCLCKTRKPDIALWNARG